MKEAIGGGPTQKNTTVCISKHSRECSRKLERSRKFRIVQKDDKRDKQL